MKYEAFRRSKMAFTCMPDVELATSRLIQAIETSLNPSTVQQKRAEAYEVNIT